MTTLALDHPPRRQSGRSAHVAAPRWHKLTNILNSARSTTPSAADAGVLRERPIRRMREGLAGLLVGGCREGDDGQGELGRTVGAEFQGGGSGREGSLVAGVCA